MSASDELVAFRFRKISQYSDSELRNGELYFAKPSELNDPYDCRIDLTALWGKAINQAPLERRELLLRYPPALLNAHMLRAESLGIACFSQKMTALMWAYYADSHKGICIKYQIPSEFITSEDGEFALWSSVEYENHRLSSFLTQGASINDFEEDVLSIALTTKSKDWSHEEEFRIIRKAHGIKKINKTWVKAVFFGLATCADEKLRITKLLGSNGYSHIEVYEMKRSLDHDFDYIPSRIY